MNIFNTYDDYCREISGDLDRIDYLERFYQQALEEPGLSIQEKLQFAKGLQWCLTARGRVRREVHANKKHYPDAQPQSAGHEQNTEAKSESPAAETSDPKREEPTTAASPEGAPWNDAPANASTTPEAQNNPPEQANSKGGDETRATPEPQKRRKEPLKLGVKLNTRE